MRIFDFEKATEGLELPPFAAQRALGRAGVELTLEGWRALPLSTRQAIARAGSSFEVDVDATTLAVESSTASLKRVAPLAEPPANAPPEHLVDRLGPTRRLPASLWVLLAPLERHALTQTARGEDTPRLFAAYDEIVGYASTSTHIRPQGGVRMVNVSSKPITHRAAVATSRVVTNDEALERLLAADVPKGDVLGTARIAGIMAAKRTSELIPLCHPVDISGVDIDLTIDPKTREIGIRARVESVSRTGAEMEALVAASVAALSVYDMLKSFDRTMVIGPTQLVAKSGGRSGSFGV